MLSSPSEYRVELISIEERDELMKRYEKRILYEDKADIYGCCIKLLTDLEEVWRRWEENFYDMSANVRSHGRLIVTMEKDQDLTIKYDPRSKTAILINVDYYGWIKSIALSTAGDILEDAHGIHSLHRHRWTRNMCNSPRWSRKDNPLLWSASIGGD